MPQSTIRENQQVKKGTPLAGGVIELARNRLGNHSYQSLKKVQCTFQEGTLFLQGCLPTYFLKQMAQTAVARIEGVHSICNQIEVLRSA